MEQKTELYQSNDSKAAEIKVLKEVISIVTRAVTAKVNETENCRQCLRSFSKGLQLLEEYDHETLETKGKTIKQAVYPAFDDYLKAIHERYPDFQSDAFAKPADECFENQMRLWLNGGEPCPSIEEKAAHLLYSMVKDHFFMDGNKRIAAACFLLFLDRNNMQAIVSDETVASLILCIAYSKQQEAQTVKRMIVSVLNRKGNI